MSTNGIRLFFAHCAAWNAVLATNCTACFRSGNGSRTLRADDSGNPMSSQLWTVVTLVLAAIATGFLALGWRNHSHRSLQRALVDGADGLETSLQRCRERMGELQQMLGRLPSEMAANASSTLDARDAFQVALREVLAHRLWIRDHAALATLAELRVAREALASSKRSIDVQLARLDLVRGELTDAYASASSFRQPPRNRSRTE